MTNHAILRLSERYNKRCGFRDIINIIKQNKAIITQVNSNKGFK